MQYTVTLLLNTVNKMSKFIAISNKYDFDIFVYNCGIEVDAKSIMTIFSMNTSDYITFHIYADDIDEFILFKKELKNIEKI